MRPVRGSPPDLARAGRLSEQFFRALRRLRENTMSAKCSSDAPDHLLNCALCRRRYHGAIGRRGSGRPLTREQAQAMVQAREKGRKAANALKT